MDKADIRTLVGELHKPAPRPKQWRKVITSGIDDTWAIDLADLKAFKDVNNGFEYWMVVEDIFSRFCWVEPIKNKEAATTWAALLRVFETAGVRPRHIWSDSGKEFVNDLWKRNLKSLGITPYTTYHVSGVGPVERLIRTIKNWIYPELEIAGSNTWTELLPRYVELYNTTTHTTLGMTPLQARDPDKESQLWIHQYGDAASATTTQKPKFRVGQWVRVSVHKHIFEKGFTPN